MDSEKNDQKLFIHFSTMNVTYLLCLETGLKSKLCLQRTKTEQ